VSAAVAAGSVEGLYRVCVKVYATDSKITDDAAAFVPIFHEWIREKKLDLVLLDVADYAHTPDSPGIMLVAHEVSFALDRSDGRFGLLAQRRVPVDGNVQTAIERTIGQVRQVVDLLTRDRRVAGKLKFDKTSVRIESNDRLRAPNRDEGFESLKPWVTKAVESAYGVKDAAISRVENDPRDRLALVASVG
jgi:hypothetical protein